MDCLTAVTNEVLEGKVPRLFMNYGQVKPGVVCIRFAGRLDIRGVPEVQNEFMSVISTGKRAVIVDLSDVELMNSIGLGLLIEGETLLRNAGTIMILLNPQARVEKVIRMASVEEFIPIANNMEEALAKIEMAA